MNENALNSVLRTYLREHRCDLRLIFRIQGCYDYLAVSFTHGNQPYDIVFEIPKPHDSTNDQINEAFYNAVTAEIAKITETPAEM